MRALEPTSPHQQRLDPVPAEELREAGAARIGVDLVRRIGVGGDQVEHVLDRLHPARVVDPRLHGVRIEQPGRIVGMLDVGGGAVLEEVEAEAAPALERVEEAVGRLCR